MKINNIGGHGGPQRPEGTGKASNPQGASSSKPVVRDRLELSEAARQRSTLLETAKELPEIRKDRVDALRRAIETGSHEVDPHRLARAILEYEGEFYR